MPTGLVLLAVAYGAIANGAFQSEQVVVIVGLLSVAAVWVLVGDRWARADALNPMTLTFFALAVSAAVSGWLAGYLEAATGVVLVMFGLVCVSLVGRAADRRQREFFVTGLVLVGVIVSVVGIGAAVLHIPVLAELNNPDPGGVAIWRAASTVTYTSAAAAFLLIPTLLVASRVASIGAGPVWRVMGMLLLAGLVATLSRGGLLGLLIGAVLLLVFGDWRAVLRANWAIVLGAGVALAFVAPSLPDGAGSNLALAVLGLLLGAAVAQAQSWRVARLLLPGIAVAALVVAILVGPALSGRVAKLQGIRLNSNSIVVRQAEWAATLDLVRYKPLFGVGPGHLILILNTHGEVQRSAYFTHNEYLQLAAEQGLFGLAVLLIGLGAVFMEVFQLRQHRDWLWTGAVAGLAALAVHSGFDFLWHIFVIPLAASVTLAILSSRTWRTDIGGLALGNASSQSG